MAYSIVAEDIVVHDNELQNKRYLASAGSLSLEMNRAGVLKFIISNTNEAYLHGMLRPLMEKIYVYEDDKYLWHGRVMETKQTGSGYVSVTCEGYIGVLNDTIILPRDLPRTGDVESVFKTIIKIHNSLVEGGKRLKPKSVGLSSVPIDLTGLEDKPYTSMELIQKLFVFNPNLDVRITLDKKGCVTLINRKEDYVINQNIIYNDNLLDFCAKTDATKLFSVVYPIGANGLTLDERFVQSNEAVISFGRIYKTIEFPEITSKDELRKAALKALSYVTEMSGIELTATDLCKLGKPFEKIEIGKYVRTISREHGINKDLICNKIVIDILNQKENRYYLGVPIDRLSDTDKDEYHSITTSNTSMTKVYSDSLPITFYSR